MINKNTAVGDMDGQPVFLIDLSPEVRDVLEAAAKFAESTPPGALVDARPAMDMRDACRASPPASRPPVQEAASPSPRMEPDQMAERVATLEAQVAMQKELRTEDQMFFMEYMRDYHEWREGISAKVTELSTRVMMVAAVILFLMGLVNFLQELM